MLWLDQCRDWVKKYDPVTQEMLDAPMHHYAVVRRLSESLPANAIIVSDTGGNVIMMGHAFRSKQGQRIFTSNGNTPMGFALAGAIGAWFAAPERPIICIIGDGGMQVNLQELQTIKHYGCKIIVYVINNGILGNTKSYQRVNGKAELACGPDGYSAPDFTAIANAYGVDNVFDIVDYDRCQYEPRMSRWDAAINEMYPHLPEDEFLSNCINPPEAGWEKRR